MFLSSLCLVASGNLNVYRKLKDEVKEDDAKEEANSRSSLHQEIDSLHGKKETGSKSPSHTNGQDVFTVEAETCSEVLLFHGIILRSQLVEMFKNKVFFDEAEGVSYLLACIDNDLL